MLFFRKRLNAKIVYLGNGATKEHYDGGNIQYVKKIKDAKVVNNFVHQNAKFIGFTARKKENGHWKWYGIDENWHELNSQMVEKRLFMENEMLSSIIKQGETIFLEAQWEDSKGIRLNCGYQMFSNNLMAHAFGGMNGKTYHNTIPAFLEGIKNGYRYFEVDLSMTKDGRLVLCHGWSKANCKWTGMEYKPEFENMTYEKIMGMKVHGNSIIDARQFYQYMKEYPEYTFEIDFHNISGKAIQKIVEEMLKDFNHDSQVLDRLLIQAYSKKMYEDIDAVYHFKHYQYLVGKNIHKLDEIIDYCLEKGICVLALRSNLAKPAYVKKIRNAGLYVMCYTVNKDLAVAKKLLDSGVNTLCTDFITPKDLEETVDTFGKAPFYVYYNGGDKEVISHYENAQRVGSGTLEYKDQEIWINDGKRRLQKCKFEVVGKYFVGWKLRIQVDGKQLWYCKDHCYHTKGDFEPGTLVEPYLFLDERQLPVWTVKPGMKLVMVAVWKEN